VFSPFILEKIELITEKQNFWNEYYAIELFIFMIILAISALLPDLDEENSWLSKKIPIISAFTGKLQHRGLTHYFIIPLIIYFGGIYIIPTSQHIILFIVVAGWVLHILGDSFTKSGIPKAFFPLSFTFGILPKPFRFRTYGFVEMKIVLPILFFIYLYEIYLIIDNVDFN